MLSTLFNKNHITMRVSVFFLLFMMVMAVFFPFSPWMPVSNLDGSWVFAINQAVAQNLTFGKQLVFTYGPYASIITHCYHPATATMMFAGNVYLALIYSFALALLITGVRWYWILTFGILFLGLTYSDDALIFSLPQLIGLVSFKLIHDKSSLFYQQHLAGISYGLLALLFSCFGLLPLIKGSFILLCVAVIILCMFLFVAHKKKGMALTCLLAPLFFICLFWQLSGQALVNLPYYFMNMAPIMAGYTVAMSYNGPAFHVIAYLIAAAVTIRAIFMQKNNSWQSNYFLAALYTVVLFMAFKEAFVRHDGHALTASTALILAAAILPFFATASQKRLFCILLLSLLTCFYINIPYLGFPYRQLKQHYQTVWSALMHGIPHEKSLNSEFERNLSQLKTQANFPLMAGTTDIYSFDQAALIASGNHWVPRPVFQSYSAYTPSLIEQNKQHLLGKQAPDNIIFRIEPIDNRLPSTEDSASWPILLDHYTPTHMQADFLFLKKKETTHAALSTPIPLTEITTYKLGHTIQVPESKRLVFAEINIQPTLLGRLATLLLKSGRMHITLKLRNGLEERYRIIPGMLRSGFLLSPLVKNTDDFSCLYGKVATLDHNRVTAFSIALDSFTTKLFWKSRYTARLYSY